MPPFTGVGWPMRSCPPFQRVLSSQLKETFVFCESKKPGFLTLQYKTVKLCSFWFNLPKNVQRGGGQKYSQPRKNYLTNSGYFGGNFYIWGDSFQEGQIPLGKILDLYFRGKFIFWGQVLVTGNLKSLFQWQILFWGAFFSLGKFVYGKS